MRPGPKQRAHGSTTDDLIPDGMTVPVLADQIHTGEPFLACLDGLSWNDVFRASDTTQIEHPTTGWMPLQRVYTRANTALPAERATLEAGTAAEQDQHLETGASGISTGDLVCGVESGS